MQAGGLPFALKSGQQSCFSFAYLLVKRPGSNNAHNARFKTKALRTAFDPIWPHLSLAVVSEAADNRRRSEARESIESAFGGNFIGHRAGIAPGGPTTKMVDAVSSVSSDQMSGDEIFAASL